MLGELGGRAHEFARSVNRFTVHAGECRGQVGGQFAVLQRKLHTGAHGTCGATAHAVDDHEGGSGFIERGVYRFGESNSVMPASVRSAFMGATSSGGYMA